MEINKIRFTIISISMCLVLLSGIINSTYSQQILETVKGKQIGKVGEDFFYIKNGQKTDRIITDELIVRHNNKVDLRNFDFSELNLKSSDFEIKSYIEDFYILKIKTRKNYLGIAKKIELSGLFDTVDFNSYLKFATITPSDPFYVTDQQYLNGDWSYSQNLELHEAWDYTTGDPSVVIGLIDSGVDYNHLDLDESIWVNSGEDINSDGVFTSGDLDGIDNDNNGFVDDIIGWDFERDFYDPIDDNSHGTFTAGIMVAETNNLEGGGYFGMSGIAGGWGNEKGASLMVLRTGGDLDAQVNRTQVINAIYYASNNGADIINMSLSTQTYYSDLQSVVDHAVNDQGIVLVGSAGNTGGLQSPNKTIGYPAKFSNTIAVGAAIFDDTRWETPTNKGSSIGPELDLLAPGGAPYIFTTAPGGGWADHSGTSASAPHVSGIVALMLSINPDLTWEDVRDILRSTADKVNEMGGANFTNYHGYGRVNANEAVSKALDYKNGNIIIDQNTTFTDRTFVDKTIRVQQGITLTLNGTITLDQGTFLYVDGILEIPSTATLELKNGSDLIINDGGVVNNFSGNTVAKSGSCTLVYAGGIMKIGNGATVKYDGGFIAGYNEGVYQVEENAKIVIKNTSNNSAINTGTIFKLGKDAEIIIEDEMEIDGATFERLNSNEAWKHIKLLSDNNTFTNSTFKGAEKGVYVASSGNIFDGGYFIDNAIGLYLSSGDATLKGVMVDQNPVEDGGNDGAVVRGSATLYTEGHSPLGTPTRFRFLDRGVDIADFGRVVAYHTEFTSNDYNIYMLGDGDFDASGTVTGQGYGSITRDPQTIYDIYNLSSNVASAQFNYWGSTTSPPHEWRFYGNVSKYNPLSCNPLSFSGFNHCPPIGSGGGCSPFLPCEATANLSSDELVAGTAANGSAASTGPSSGNTAQAQKIKEAIQSIFTYLSEHPNDPDKQQYVRYIHSLLQTYDGDGAIRAWAGFDDKVEDWLYQYMTTSLKRQPGQNGVVTAVSSERQLTDQDISKGNGLGQTAMIITLSDAIRDGNSQTALQKATLFEPFMQDNRYRVSLWAAKAVAWEQTGQFGKALAAYEKIEHINMNEAENQEFSAPDYSVVKAELADSMAARKQSKSLPLATASTQNEKQQDKQINAFKAGTPSV